MCWKGILQASKHGYKQCRSQILPRIVSVNIFRPQGQTQCILVSALNIQGIFNFYKLFDEGHVKQLHTDRSCLPSAEHYVTK